MLLKTNFELILKFSQNKTLKKMSTNDSKESVLKLLDIKESNQLICYDFRVSLFVCALNSYRCNSILKPFPNLFINSFNNEKQFDFVVILLFFSIALNLN